MRANWGQTGLALHFCCFSKFYLEVPCVSPDLLWPKLIDKISKTQIQNPNFPSLMTKKPKPTFHPTQTTTHPTKYNISIPARKNPTGLATFLPASCVPVPRVAVSNTAYFSPKLRPEKSPGPPQSPKDWILIDWFDYTNILNDQSIDESIDGINQSINQSKLTNSDIADDISVQVGHEHHIELLRTRNLFINQSFELISIDWLTNCMDALSTIILSNSMLGYSFAISPQTSKNLPSAIFLENNWMNQSIMNQSKLT